MSFLDWLNPINKAEDIISEAVEDKDKRNELNAHLAELREKVYLAELQTKTIPWVDAVHKMGRQLLSWASLIIPAVLLYKHPDINPLALGSIVAPGGIYNFVKGKGAAAK